MSTDTPTPAEQIFEKHWKKATGKELDETTRNHMQYAIDAVEEALHCKPESAPTPETEKPLTWDECVDKVAREMFNNVPYDIGFFKRIYAIDLEKMFARAALLLAESAFNRGAREQREICFGNRRELYLCIEDYYQEFDKLATEYLLNAPAPQFKA